MVNPCPDRGETPDLFEPMLALIKDNRYRLYAIAANPFAIFFLFAIVPIALQPLRPDSTGYFGAVLWGLPATKWPYLLLGFWLNREFFSTHDFTRNWKKGLLAGIALSPVIFFVFSYLTAMFVNSSLAGWLAGTSFIKAIIPFSLPIKTGSSMIFQFPGEHIFEAVVEELFYRGLLLTLIREHTKSSQKAVLWSALFFALGHGQVILMPYYFLWGTCVGLAYVLSGSLLAPILIHSFNNGFIDFKIWSGSW